MIAFAVLLTCVPLVWLSLHIFEYRRSKNGWVLPTVAVFLLASITMITGLVTLFLSSGGSEYVVWKSGAILAVGVALTACGALLRFLLRATDRVGPKVRRLAQ